MQFKIYLALRCNVQKYILVLDDVEQIPLRLSKDSVE